MRLPRALRAGSPVRGRGRALTYALLALALPLPAFALEGGEPGPGMGVSASLDGCGILDSAVVCKIDATWNDVAGADRYTATLTNPDGSVVDQGEVEGGGSSFWAPYAGSGTYTVTISAWADAPGDDQAEGPENGGQEMIASEESRTEPGAGGAGDHEPVADPGAGEGDEPVEQPPVEEPPVDPPAEQPPPACEETPEPSDTGSEAGQAPAEVGSAGEAQADGESAGEAPAELGDGTEHGEGQEPGACAEPEQAG